MLRIALATSLIGFAAAARAEPTELPDAATDTIVVTGTRRTTALKDSPIAVEVVTRQQIEASQARTAAEALDRALGLVVTSSFSGDGVEIQGLSARHVLVLVDGERVAGKVAEQLDLSRLPADAIERIEVVKGAGSAIYGSDAIGGVIQIITRKARLDPEADVDLVVGDGERAEIASHAAYRGEVVGLAGSFSFRRQGAYTLDPSTPATSGSSFDDLASALRLDARFDGWRFDARVQHLYREQAAVDATPLPDGLDGRPRWRLIDRTERLHEWQARLGATVSLDDHQLELSLGTSLAWSWLIEDQRAGDQYDRRQPTTETVSGAHLQWLAALGDHRLTTGLELDVETLASERLGGGDPERVRVALYTQDEWRLVAPDDDGDGELTLVAGVRFDHDSEFGGALTPRVAVRWDPWHELALRASFGLGFRAPGFRELYLVFENPSVGYRVEGNPALSPERSRSLELSAEWRPDDVVAATLGLFRHDLDDLIVTLPPVSREGELDLYGYDNIDSAVAQGVETRLVLGPKPLTLELGYAFTDSRDGDGVRIAGRATHQLTGRVSWRPALDGERALNLGLGATVLGPRPFDIDVGGGLERVSSDWQALVDARAAIDLEAHLALVVGVDNALDAGDPELFQVRPRNLYLGLHGRL